MSPAEIIERATEESVLLALSPSGSISAKGDQSAIDRWLPAIKQSKAAIIAELQLERAAAPRCWRCCATTPASATPSRW
jgi:hypothetical protein